MYQIVNREARRLAATIIANILLTVFLTSTPRWRNLIAQHLRALLWQPRRRIDPMERGRRAYAIRSLEGANLCIDDAVEARNLYFEALKLQWT